MIVNLNSYFDELKIGVGNLAKSETPWNNGMLPRKWIYLLLNLEKISHTESIIG